MESDPNVRQASQALSEANERAKAARRQLAKVLADRRLRQDEQFAELERQKAELRKKIHREKLTIGRKNFSIRTKLAAVERVKGEIDEVKAGIDQLESQVSEAARHQERLRERLLAEVMASLQ